MKNVKQIILLILIIINCLVIFSFSSQQGDESSGTSEKVVEYVIKKVYGDENLSEQQILEIKENITTPIRKLAHFSIYTCLGALIYMYINTYEIKKYKFLISWGLGILYACTDELHQKFVPGRSAEITDVCIDGLGVIFGISIVIFILKMINKRTKKD